MSNKNCRKKIPKLCAKFPFIGGCPPHPRNINTKAYNFMIVYILLAEYMYTYFNPKKEVSTEKGK